jgi:hypothetical protein
MTFKKFTFAIAMAVAAVATQAETFNYSYTFADGTKVTGSFDGTSDGTLVTGLTNISANINGIAFNGSGALFGSSYEDNSGYVSGGAVASFDGRNNNFMFNDNGYAAAASGEYTNYFYSGTAGGPPKVPNYDVYAGGHWTYDYEYGHNRVPYVFSAEQWSLRSVNAVPEPETYALMLAGLGLMGSLVKRRKAKQTA